MSVTFKFPKACKVDLAVSKSFIRYPLENPYCDGKRVTATDGHILAVVPVELEEKFIGPIPCELFRRGRRIGGKKKENMDIVVTDDVLRVNSERVMFERDKSDFTYPDVNKPIEQAQKAEPAVTFYINPKLLMNLAEAIGSTTHVKITVPKPDSRTGNITAPVTVYPCYPGPLHEGAFGLIMAMLRP